MLNTEQMRGKGFQSFAESLRRLCAVILVACLLTCHAAAYVSKGQKNFKQGLEHEAAQQWEKAAEEFALAVAAEPSNTEYQLHYRRAIFNASQMFMQQGVSLVERGDYLGAYNAFRRAYGYDPVNELARSMMERTLRLQMGKDGAGGTSTGADTPKGQSAARAKLTPTAYQPNYNGKATPSGASQDEDAPLASPRAEQLRVINYSGELEGFIKYLARQLRINVVFDRDFPKRTVDIDMQEVTAAQALDYIFLTQGLFFQKLSSRTIVVADQTKRPQYQQLVLRTFYLSNIDPNDARSLIQASIPPQAGRQPVITPNKTTNSITVRDTPENIRLIGDILKSIDKERAEVVMDVNIYEVSRTDLMQLGNQLGTDTSLRNMGGIQKGLTILGGSREVVTQGLAAVTAPTALGAALVIPSSTLNALQRKDMTRLIASTQVHAFDGEKSTAHIGQRVPVQTASVASFGTTGTGDQTNPQQGVATGLFGGTGFPVIQYEKTGLTLEFTPQVFSNLDVQVKMTIKSNDVTNTGAATLTPTFTERNIEGTARIQNNRTMMIASVAQNQQSRGRQGLPVLGLVPVFGRLFTAPRRNDQQTDIVIAVTPHVLRAPALVPSDEEARPTGTLQTPNSDTLEAMLQEMSHEDQMIAARSIPRNRVVEIPASEAAGVDESQAGRAVEPEAAGASVETGLDETTTFVPAPKALLDSVAQPDTSRAASAPAENRPNAPATRTRFVSAQYPANTAHRVGVGVVPEQASAVAPAPASDAADGSDADSLSASRRVLVDNVNNTTTRRSAAELRLAAESQPMRVGERRRLKLLLKTDAPLGLVAASVHFDPALLAVRSITRGNLLDNDQTSSNLRLSVTPEGLILIAATPLANVANITGAGVFLSIEVEALAPGTSPFSFEPEEVHVVATDGRKMLLKVTPGQVSVIR